MRSEFEKLSEISKRLKMSDGVYWSEHYKNYNSLNEHDDYAVGFVNGAWHAFQEQQKIIYMQECGATEIQMILNDSEYDDATKLERIQELLK